MKNRKKGRVNKEEREPTAMELAFRKANQEKKREQKKLRKA